MDGAVTHGDVRRLASGVGEQPAPLLSPWTEQKVRRVPVRR